MSHLDLIFLAKTFTIQGMQKVKITYHNLYKSGPRKTKDYTL